MVNAEQFVTVGSDGRDRGRRREICLDPFPWVANYVYYAHAKAPLECCRKVKDLDASVAAVCDRRVYSSRLAAGTIKPAVTDRRYRKPADIYFANHLLQDTRML